MQKDGRRWGAFALATVLSVAAYHLSFLGVVFLVPLQWVRWKQGEVRFWWASFLALAGIVGVELLWKAFSPSPWTVLDGAGLVVPGILVAGWVTLAALERTGWRFLYRLLVVTSVTGMVLFPWLTWLWGQADVVQAVQTAFNDAWTKVFPPSGAELPGVGVPMDKAEFFELMKQALWGSFLLVFFLFWGFTARVSRILVSPRDYQTSKDFFLPPQGVWLLLGVWGAILIQGLLGRMGIRWDWGVAEYVVLNVGWVVLFVYAFAGWGIVHALMDRWRWPRIGQAAVRVLLTLLVLVPGPGQGVVLVGLPVLAVLELWVNFRKRTQGVGL